MTSTSEKRVGLFFGSFNPMHIGHLCLAEYMIEFGGLDQVWFIVSPHNPLKEKLTLLKDYSRYEMVEQAIGDDARFKAMDIEFRLPQPSYTIDTLTHLHEKYPAKSFVLLAGTDMLQSLHKWKNYEQILENYSIMLYPRHGSDTHPLLSHPSIKMVEAPRIEISASFLRGAIKSGHSVRYFLPEKVYEIIDKYGYYR